MNDERKYFMRMRYLLVVDVACILLAFVASFVIRYEALVSVGPYLTYNQALFWLSLLVRLPLYRTLGLYDRLWRYASMREMQRIILAGTLSSGLIYGLNFHLLPVLGLRHCPSHSVVVLDWLLNIFLLGGSRFVLRLAQERMTAGDVRLLKTFVKNPRRVLVDRDAFGVTRDQLAQALLAENIDTRKYHDPPVHTHKTYRHLYDRYRDALPITDRVSAQSLSLPIYSHMDEGTVDGICRAVERVHHHRNEIRNLLPS